MKLLPLSAIAALLCFGNALSAQSYTFSSFSTALYSPSGIAVDPAGGIFVAGLSNSIIYKVSSTGAVLAQYGNGSAGNTDGTGIAARFNNPRGLVLDSAGNLYVGDSNNHTIRKITPAGAVSTFAGLAFSSGSADGTGSAARFFYPQGLAIDGTGNLYVADTNNHAIRKITPAGVVTTFAGSPGTSGSDDGAGSAARFFYPQGLAIDNAGNLYVADTSNSIIRKITSVGAVTTLAGSALNTGNADGPAALARFFTPWGVAVDGAGNVFVADTNNTTVRKIAGGVVTTIGGLAGTSGDISGVGSAARFYGPRGIAVDAAGNLFVADATYLKIGTSSSQLAITVQPQSLSVGSGSAANFSVTATGASPITYQWQKNGSAIAGATNSTLTLASVQSSDAASYTVTVNNSVGTLASTGATLTVLAPVPNDNFANAQVITGSSGSISGNNNGATGEPGEPTIGSTAGTASSVWYKWTATETGTAAFTLNSSLFTMTVWTGSTLNALARVPSASSVRPSFRVTSGTTYYFALGSLSVGSRGNFSFSWRTLLNDDFGLAQVISGDSGSVGGNNDGATTEAGEPTNPRPSTNSVWYRWTPMQSGTALFDTPDFNIVTVYTGETLAALVGVTPVATLGGTTADNTRIRRTAFNVESGVVYSIAISNGSSAFTANWTVTPNPFVASVSGSRTVSVGSSVTFSAVAIVSGTPAYQWSLNGTAIAGATDVALALSNVQTANGGNYSLRISNGKGGTEVAVGTLVVLLPPANDNFANAVSLSGLTGQISGTNVNATGEPNEPAHWNTSGAASSVWFRWVATSSGLAVVDTVGSNFDTVLAVYSGSALTSLTRLVQDDDRGGGRTSQVSFAAIAGTTYSIAVGGSTASARGNVTLNWQLTPVLAITTQPVSQTIAVGGAATFTVGATGVGATYQWNRNGVPIPGATSTTLNVSNIQAGTDASYTVTVTSAVGSVTSSPATLSVAAPTLTSFSVRRTRAQGNLLWSIAAGAGQFVAVGHEGVILTSADSGRTWAPRLSGNTGWLVAVTYGGGQFVIVGEEGRILTSPDGITWTPAAAPATRERLNNIIYADDKYVAIGEHGTVVTSLDARVWTLRATPANDRWLHGLAYHAGIRHFITSGEAGVLLYSADAITWSQLPVPGFTGNLHHIVAVESYAHFVVAADQGKVISVRQNQLVLKDGQPLTTWTAEALATNTTAGLIGLVQGAGALFATGEDGQVITATNDHGPWYALRSGAQGYLTAGMYFNNRLYIVGQQETVIESEPIYATRLVNISTRGQVGTGGNILISGFIVNGSTAKRVLVRAVGPALSGFGVTGQLAAPVLTLFNKAGEPIGTNSGWGNATNSAAIATAATTVGAFPFATGSADSALLMTLNPGNYTAQIAGVNNTTGVALVEAYDTEPLSIETAQTVNVSTRGVVGAGQDKMIAGFVIDGSSARRVLIRAVGPALAAFGVEGVVAEPQLELYTSRGLLVSTAGAWGLQSNADEIRGAAKQASAFAFAEGSKDAAVLVTLLPGAWTVQIGGAAGTSGVALVEVYVLP